MTTRVTSPRRPLLKLSAAVGVLATALGCAPPPTVDDADAPRVAAMAVPADDSAEAGFARDMATHHDQAIEMAFMVRDATTDPRLRSLADDIIVTQSAQRGMFMAWLQLWDLPQASAGPRMAWMADGSGDAESMAHMHEPDGGTGLTLMAGMASNAELAELEGATGRDAEVRFLQLMIRHHEGGVLMARALLERSNHDVVVTLARGIEAGQMGEIEAMTGMLADREAEPLPSLLP